MSVTDLLQNYSYVSLNVLLRILSLEIKASLRLTLQASSHMDPFISAWFINMIELVTRFVTNDKYVIHFTATTTECDLCNKNGQCVIQDSQVSCECRDWFAGRNCQINLKLLLIVGCVSVVLMIVIAFGVSCFCCRDRRAGKNDLPCKNLH